VSDTIIGQRRYFARQWSSSVDTVLEWLYILGNEVFILRDLAKPDSAIKIAQKSYATGDSIYDGTGLFEKVQLVVSYHGRDSAPAGTYDSTWTAGWVDADTIAGGLILIRNEIHHVYAHEVGEIRATGKMHGTPVAFLLDSFYIAPDNAIRNKKKPGTVPGLNQTQRVTIVTVTDRINPNTDRVYGLNGRLLHNMMRGRTSRNRQLPSALLIAVPKKQDKNSAR
jgi:hypothetical protein